MPLGTACMPLVEWLGFRSHWTLQRHMSMNLFAILRPTSCRFVHLWHVHANHTSPRMCSSCGIRASSTSSSLRNSSFLSFRETKEMAGGVRLSIDAKVAWCTFHGNGTCASIIAWWRHIRPRPWDRHGGVGTAVRSPKACWREGFRRAHKDTSSTSTTSRPACRAKWRTSRAVSRTTDMVVAQIAPSNSAVSVQFCTFAFFLANSVQRAATFSSSRTRPSCSCISPSPRSVPPFTSAIAKIANSQHVQRRCAVGFGHLRRLSVRCTIRMFPRGSFFSLLRHVVCRTTVSTCRRDGDGKRTWKTKATTDEAVKGSHVRLVQARRMHVVRAARCDAKRRRE